MRIRCDVNSYVIFVVIFLFWGCADTGTSHVESEENQSVIPLEVEEPVQTDIVAWLLAGDRIDWKVDNRQLQGMLLKTYKVDWPVGEMRYEWVGDASAGRHYILLDLPATDNIPAVAAVELETVGVPETPDGGVALKLGPTVHSCSPVGCSWCAFRRTQHGIAGCDCKRVEAENGYCGHAITESVHVAAE